MAQLKNTTINDTGFLQLPTGTTAQRPVSAQQGQLRYNTETRNIEWYDSTYNSWFPTGVVPPIATGGTITNITQGGVNYRVHTFTNSGTFTVTRGGQIEYLIVAGGGGGGDTDAGGGGAGGLLTGTTTVTAQAYTITVGAGGPRQTVNDIAGNNGQNTSALGFTAIGGGGGGCNINRTTTQPPKSGGSSGGNGSFTTSNPALPTPGQGNIGGVSGGGAGGGGGGGAGSPGSNGPYGNGGVGIVSTITGTAIVYGDGGGGGHGNTTFGGSGRGGQGFGGGNGTDAQPNSGAGGGGGGGGNGDGGAGGSGIVIVRYRTS